MSGKNNDRKKNRGIPPSSRMSWNDANQISIRQKKID